MEHRRAAEVPPSLELLRSDIAASEAVAAKGKAQVIATFEVIRGMEAGPWKLLTSDDVHHLLDALRRYDNLVVWRRHFGAAACDLPWVQLPPAGDPLANLLRGDRERWRAPLSDQRLGVLQRAIADVVVREREWAATHAAAPTFDWGQPDGPARLGGPPPNVRPAGGPAEQSNGGPRL